jgi:hypothetical protein
MVVETNKLFHFYCTQNIFAAAKIMAVYILQVVAFSRQPKHFLM